MPRSLYAIGSRPVSPDGVLGFESQPRRDHHSHKPNISILLVIIVNVLTVFPFSKISMEFGRGYSSMMNIIRKN